jgi:outer membrane protein assembly factor BamA
MINRLTTRNGGRTSFSRSGLFVVAWACAASAGAQDTSPIGAVHDQTLAHDSATGAAPGLLERAVSWAEIKMDGQTGLRDGFYPELGGMIPGAGLSAGPGYRHHLFGDRAIVDASAAMSWRRYTMMQSQIAWPGLLNDRLSVGGQVKYQDFKQINFFGIGNGSLSGNRTDYRLKDLDTLAFATVRANPWLSMTGRTGLLRRVDVARGASTLHPSTVERFDEGSAPGVTRQPNYLHADVALDVDTRDTPGYPASGGRYRVSMAMFHDQDFSSYSFRRVEADAAQYISLGRSVLAFHGRMDLSQTGAGQDVPFYLLPSLGGSNSLRGYQDYRFRDRDLLMLNAEYRWPIVRRIDAAVFYDTGTVGPRAGDLSRDRHADYGVGMRLHTATHLLARVDVARGHEGMRTLFTFSMPLSVPGGTIAPYVP